MKKIAVLTTFNDKGYSHYAKKMLQTFIANWPKAVDLYVYAEDCAVEETADNLHVIDLLATVPELAAFKQKWGNVPKAIGQVATGPITRKGKQQGIGFKWDAVRFSHKIYSVCHAAGELAGKADWLLWADADTIWHSPITEQELSDFCPDEYDLAFLGRKGKYTECGLYAMNLNSIDCLMFLERFQWVYDNAEQGIFTMSEWHDSFVFDRVKEQFALKELDWAKGIITGEGHPLINSRWGLYADHLKGNRKDIGHSIPSDIKIIQHCEYWQRILAK